MSPARLAAARDEWAALAALPAPRIALLVGGPVRAEGDGPRHRRRASAPGSRASPAACWPPPAAAPALARPSAWPRALAGVPHRLHRWGDAGPNPYAGFLAWADAVVVTGDSVSMLSEALATAAPVFIADPGGLGPRHLRLHESLIAAGQARPLAAAPAPFGRRRSTKAAGSPRKFRAGLVR